MTEKKNMVRISKRCPVCNSRILDKVTPTEGIIELKCPKCRKTVKVNLSYRISAMNPTLRYRKASCF